MRETESITGAIVDDDESLCRSLARLLRIAGFDASTFLSAEALIENHPDDFDFFVFDIQLGGMTGVELKDYLSAHGCEKPVVFITAHDDPEMQSRAIRTGCAGFFKKSDPGSAIIDSIRRATACQPKSKSSR